MRRLAAWSHDRHRLVIGLWIAAVIGAGVLAGVAGGSFSNNFSLPGSESQRALDLLQERFPQQAGDSSQIVFRADTGTLKDAALKQRVQKVVEDVDGLPSVESVGSPYAAPTQISKDGRTAFATLQFDKQADKLDKADIEKVIDTASSGAGDGLQVNLGGQAIQVAQQQEQSAAELVGVAVAIIVLMFVLGSFAAMTMPLIIAFAAILIASLLTAAASAVFDIADFAPTLAVMIALGVGIDYALLVINRFRGERALGNDVRESTLIAMDTAGRSVLFAGTTVVIALLGMLVLGISFLNAPAFAAALAVALTMVGSLTLLPALLGTFIGRRVKVGKAKDPDTEPGGWARWARTVERRPAAFAVVATLVLLVFAVPVLGMNLGFTDAGGDGSGTTTRKAYDQLSEGFGAGFNGPLLVVSEVPAGGDSAASLGRLETALKGQDGVKAVTTPVLNDAKDTATITVFPTTKPQDPETTDLLKHLRDDTIPPVADATGLRVSIGGSTATTADLSDIMAAKLPLFVLIVVGLSLLLLTIVFRSLLIPVKAGILNILSIGAALGVITWVFQDGHLASLIGVETTGPILPFIPVFMFAIVFGLSMDYEVFLVSRMHEEWQKRHDAAYAVRHGLALTGKVVMAAAIIMISVFGSFVFGDNATIKMFGLGLATAVFVDAFIIRLVLVPALMYLFGESSWWLPGVLQRRLPRLSIEGPERPRPVAEAAE